MSRMVNCVKLGKEAEGLERITYPGDLGKRIFDNVSKEAWGGWVQHLQPACARGTTCGK